MKTQYVKTKYNLSQTGIEIKAGKYYGIFDNGGIEGILFYDESTKAKRDACDSAISMSKIRATANLARDAHAFVTVLTQKEATEIFDAVDRKKWHLAKRRLGNVIKLEVF